MSCSTSADFLTVRNQCVDMLLDRGISLKDIPEAPPKSLIARYLMLSHEKGDSPLLDIPVEENPVLFLYQGDKITFAPVKTRVLNTLKYHGLNTNRKITVVYLGDKTIDSSLEFKLGLEFDAIQVYHWKTLLVPIQKHRLVPKHTPIKDDDKIQEIMQKYRLINMQQLPGIQVTDPMARHLFLEVGDIVHINRQGTDAYRICVNPVLSVD